MDGGVGEDGGAAVLNALVVDDSAAARRRTRTVLRLGGWRVYDAVGMTEALRQAAAVRPGLVVTDMTMREGSGPALMRALRDSGCPARFLAVADAVTAKVRARATEAGAGACLAKPVDPRELVDFLLDGVDARTGQGRGPGATGEFVPSLRVEAERLDQQRDAYRTALPHRIATVVGNIQEGNVAAAGCAARLLGRASEQAGQEGVARICAAIAADAERGVLSRSRVTQLVAFSAGASPAVAALTPGA